MENINVQLFKNGASYRTIFVIYNDQNKYPIAVSYLPNLLTLLRIGLVPVLILLMQNQSYTMALCVFVIAGITDGLDGYIAKRYACITRLGSVLDPLADKLLLLSSFVMLTIAGALPFWLLIIAAFRDLVIVTGVIILTILYDHFEMKPIWSSKINTFLQIVLVIAVLIEKAGILSLYDFIRIMIWLVTSTILISGFQYVYEWGFRKVHTEDATKT